MIARKMAQVKERRVLIYFLAQSKPKIPFHGLFLLRNQTETLATQASLRAASQIFNKTKHFFESLKYYLRM